MTSQIRVILLALCCLSFLVVAASVSYYYAVALPRHNREALDFEREKYAAQVAESDRKRKEAEEKAKWEKDEMAANQFLLNDCLKQADDAYWSYMRLNGEEVEGKPGVITAKQYIWDTAAKDKKRRQDECYRLYK